MSRIGRMPIAIPAGVDVKIDGQHVTVKGGKSELSLDVHPDITVKLEDGQILVSRPSDDKNHRALHGLTRALIQNMVTGVHASAINTPKAAVDVFGEVLRFYDREVVGIVNVGENMVPLNVNIFFLSMISIIVLIFLNSS